MCPELSGGVWSSPGVYGKYAANSAERHEAVPAPWLRLAHCGYCLRVVDSSSGHVLALVQKALDELDDRPLDATARRAARIASMLGETELAVRLGMELKPHGGLPSANRADTERFLTDATSWSDPDGPIESAFSAYSALRTIESGENAGKILAHSLTEIIYILDRFDRAGAPDGLPLLHSEHLRRILDGVRHTVFAALCAWERQMTYADVNERIFNRFRSRVDATLSLGAPALLDQFSAVYRRLREAAQESDGSANQEDFAQAVSTCRRTLKAVADHILPGIPGATAESGHPLDDSAYRNRIHEFVKRSVSSESTADSVKAAYGGLIERFNTLDKLANKGVHAELGLHEAELCAINTYLVTGELLDIAARAT